MRGHLVLGLLCLQALLVLGATPVRPATSAAPFFVGLFDVTSTPSLSTPGAPAMLQAKGVARRAAGYPAAPDLSLVPVERMSATLKTLGVPHAPPPRPWGSGGDGEEGGSQFADGWEEETKEEGQEAEAAALSQGSGEVGAAATTAAPLTSQRRRLQQEQQEQQQPKAGGGVGRVQLRRRASVGSSRGGFPGATLNTTDAPAASDASSPSSTEAPSHGAASIAASASRAVHITGGHMAIYALDPDTGARTSTIAVLRLQDVFSPVGSSNCRHGVHDGHAVFDANAGRFYVAAACGGTGSALLAVSTTEEPGRHWYLYNLGLDGVGTKLACPNGESLLVDYPRVGFNADAVAVTVHTHCPTSGGAPGAPGEGAAIALLPKAAVTTGEMRTVSAVFTSYEVAAAAVTAGGDAVAPAPRVVQLEPAVPQGAADVKAGEMYFLADVVAPAGQPRKSVLLVSLINTGAMWSYGTTSPPSASDAPGPTPFVTALLVDRGSAVAAPSASAAMPQPEGAPSLDAAALPAGFWNGRAIWSDGKVWAADGALSPADPSTGSAPTPTIAWVVVEPSLRLIGGGSCASTLDWGAGFDYAVNRTADFGQTVQPVWETFVARAANVTRIGEQAARAWGGRPLRPRTGSPAGSGGGGARRRGGGGGDAGDSGGGTDGGLEEGELSGGHSMDETGGKEPFPGAEPMIVVKKAVADVNKDYRATEPEAARALSRTDVSPFVLPTAEGVAALPVEPTGEKTISWFRPRRLNGLNTYGGFYGWDCWTCIRYRNSYGLGTNGFYVTSKFYPMFSQYNWGWTGLGRVWWRGGYGGGWGYGGWGGHYFGGITQGTSWMNSFNWNGGNGGMGAWSPGVTWDNRGGSYGGFGWVVYTKRRRLQGAPWAAPRSGSTAGGTNDSGILTGGGVIGGGGGAGSSRGLSDSESPGERTKAAVAIARAAAVASSKMRPVCLAPSQAACQAAAAAKCPRGSEPRALLSARLVAHGVLSPKAASGLAFAAPSVVLGRNGTLLIAATYSGSGRIKGSGAPAFPGLATLSVSPHLVSATLRIEQRGTRPLAPAAARASGAWPAPPALAVQPGSGFAYLTAERAPGGDEETWVSLIDPEA